MFKIDLRSRASVIALLNHYMKHGQRGSHIPRWMGRKFGKYPIDAMIYQSVLWHTQPDILIETGTWHGGSAQYFADIMTLLGNGRVISVDITNDNPPSPLPEHPRVSFISGSSIDPLVLEQLRAIIQSEPEAKVMVVLDSDHTHQHVLQELELYAPLVSPNMYLVVEDVEKNIYFRFLRAMVALLENRPVSQHGRVGAKGAMAEYLQNHPDVFTQTTIGTRAMFSQQPTGWLQKKAAV